MKATQFGNLHFYPKDVIAMHAAPLRTRNRESESVRYLVYIKGISNPVILEGEAATKCLEIFSGEVKTADKDEEKEQEETPLEGDKE